MKSRLISILLIVMLLASSLTSCGVLPYPFTSDDENATVTFKFYVDGVYQTTQTVVQKDYDKTEIYQPEEKEGYRFIGWFTDETCEIPYYPSEHNDKKTIVLYGKYIPISTGNEGCDHFWILGYCRICEATCTHTWDHAVCQICDMPCDHGNTKLGDTCKTCGKNLKSNSIVITVISPDESDDTTSKVEFPTSMYLDEIFAHCMTFFGYKYRHSVFDIKIDGEPVTDGSVLIDKDCTLEVTIKKDVITVNTTIIEANGSTSYQVIHLPKTGITLERLGLLAFPQSGGFDKLKASTDIEIDGKKITDGSYLINQNCHLTFTVKSTPTDPKPSDISVRIVIESTGEVYEERFSKHEVDGETLSQLIRTISGLDLDEMLASGVVTLNGSYIYSDGVYSYNEENEIVYTELKDGQIQINFSAIGDMGDSDMNESAVITVNAGITYEEVVSEMLGLTWEEYEAGYFSTQSDNYTAIYRDTVLNKSIDIWAIKYRNHDKTEKVQLVIELNFDGIEKTRLELDYGTSLSEALKQIGLDLNVLLADEEVFLSFNVRPLVTDVKIKYNSHILGWRTCDEHEWRDRQCVKCGAICYNVYYDNADCSICGCYHPTERELIGITFQWVTASGDFKENSDVRILEGQTLEEVILKVDGRDLEEILSNNTVYMNDEEIVYFDCIVEKGAVIRIATDHCDHDWKDGHCRKCLRYCEHSFFEKSCTICDVEKQDPGVPVYVYLEVNNATVTEFEIEFGTALEDVIRMAGYDSLESMLENGELKVYGHPVQVGDDLHLYGDERIYYMENKPVCSNHKWSNGVCTLCQTYCDYIYFDDGDCPICDSYHPQKSTNGKKISVKFYVYDESGKMIESNHKVEMPYGSHLKEAMGYVGWDDLDILLKEGRLTVNSVEVKAGDDVILYGGEKVEYFRGSPS